MFSSHRDLLGFYPTCRTEGSGKQNELETEPKLLNHITGWIGDIVKTTHSLADRRASVGLVRAELRCQHAAGLQGSVVNGLKDLNVEQLRLWAFKGITHEDEGISQTLHTDSNGPVSLVRPLGL